MTLDPSLSTAKAAPAVAQPGAGASGPTMTFGSLSTVTYAVNGVSFDMVRLPPGRFVDG